MRTNEGDLLTRAQLAKLIGIAEHTINNGGGGTRELPFIKLGSAIRYRRSDVERWLEERTRMPFNPRLSERALENRPRLLRRKRKA